MNGAAAVAIDEAVMAIVRAFLAEDCARERGGFLIGRLAGAGLPMTQVDHAVPCPDAPSTAYTLTFRADEWQLAQTHPAVSDGSASIVGWFHSHPSMSVRMSAQDRFIQRHFFQHPAQVAWIHDPVGGDEAFWCLRDGTIERMERVAYPADGSRSSQ
jgi:proteasome lid subunit RPN8/RPN11